jgi:hypothetical protein
MLKADFRRLYSLPLSQLYNALVDHNQKFHSRVDRSPGVKNETVAYEDRH